MTNSHPSGAPWRNFYGRFKGKSLRPEQERRLAEDLPRLALPDVDWSDNPDRRKIDPAALFGTRDVWLEIGFGSGEHMVHQAGQNPETGIIGCEPYVNGVAVAIGKIAKAGCENIKLHAGDARDVFDVLPDGVIAKAFLLYPDPWPKARHHRRRFVTPEHLAPLHRVMAPGAELRVATDIPDYVRQAMIEIPRAGFIWQAERCEDWRQPWGDWISTRYEQKALREGRVPHYLTFRRA